MSCERSSHSFHGMANLHKRWRDKSNLHKSGQEKCQILDISGLSLVNYASGKYFCFNGIQYYWEILEVKNPAKRRRRVGYFPRSRILINKTTRDMAVNEDNPIEAHRDLVHSSSPFLAFESLRTSHEQMHLYAYLLFVTGTTGGTCVNFFCPV